MVSKNKKIGLVGVIPPKLSGRYSRKEVKGQIVKVEGDKLQINMFDHLGGAIEVDSKHFSKIEWELPQGYDDIATDSDEEEEDLEKESDSEAEEEPQPPPPTNPSSEPLDTWLNEVDLETTQLPNSTRKPIAEKHVELNRRLRLKLVTADKVSDAFKLFFNGEMCETLVENTNRYGGLKYEKIGSGNDFNDCCKDEMLAFIGGHLFMDIINAPDMRFYWDTSGDFFSPGASAVAKVFVRDRFLELNRNMHFSDPNDPRDAYGSKEYEKGFKTARLFELFTANLKSAWCSPTATATRVCYDEAMIKFKGRVTFKCYQPNKPIKRGIKIHCVNDSLTGALLNCELYLGKYIFF